MQFLGTAPSVLLDACSSSTAIDERTSQDGTEGETGNGESNGMHAQ